MKQRVERLTAYGWKSFVCNSNSNIMKYYKECKNTHLEKEPKEFVSSQVITSASLTTFNFEEERGQILEVLFCVK